MLTMAPVFFAASMRRAASCAQKNTASRLVPTTRRHSSSVQLDCTGRVRHAGVVDQDGDGAERLLGFIEGAHHGLAVEHVGADRHCAAAGRFDPRLDGREPVGAARHQRHRRAVLGQHLGEAHAEPARRAGDQRDTAGEIEQFGGAVMLIASIKRMRQPVASPGTYHSTTSARSWISTNGMMPT